MQTTKSNKPSKNTTPNKKHVLWDCDCCEVRFTEMVDNNCTDKVMFVESYGDGELLGGGYMPIEKARELYAKYLKLGWVKPY